MNPSSRLRLPRAALSSRERSFLLAAALAIALFAAGKWLVLPLRAEHARNLRAIPLRLSELERGSAAARGEGKLAERLAERRKELVAMEKALLPGETPSAAGAALQGMVKSWAAGADTRVVSLRTLPPVPRGAYAEVGVQADLQTTTAGLADLLSRIPKQERRLKVNRIGITSPAFSPAMANRSEVLSVSVVVAGLVRDMTPGNPGGKEQAR